MFIVKTVCSNQYISIICEYFRWMPHYERTEILLSLAFHISIPVWQVLATVFKKPDSSSFPWTFLKIDL